MESIEWLLLEEAVCVHLAKWSRGLCNSLIRMWNDAKQADITLGAIVVLWYVELALHYYQGVVKGQKFWHTKGEELGSVFRDGLFCDVSKLPKWLQIRIKSLNAQ